MLINDFSSGFDTLLNSYLRKGNFGDTQPDIRLDEYEKSIFLTKAQEEVALALYNGKNPFNDSFESTEEMRRYLSDLILEAQLSPFSNFLPDVFDATFDYTFHKKVKKFIGIDARSQFFKLPDNLWFITYEAVAVGNPQCEGMRTLDVYPIRQDEYHKVKRNPFRGFNNRRALRLDLPENYVEIVSKYDITDYYIRYLKKLKPIILIDLADDQNIEGETSAIGCELHESLHQRILERAVQTALISKGIKVSENK